MDSIKKIKVSDLLPYARNARTHDDEQVAQIAGSIKEFGFINPVITDGENGIIAGHGRVMAAKKLGMAEVPCLEASHLTEVQKRAYILADNRLAESSGWDSELLQVELEGLIDDGFDIDLTGFGDYDLGTDDSPADDPKEDDQEKKKKTVTCPNCGHEVEK